MVGARAWDWHVVYRQVQHIYNHQLSLETLQSWVVRLHLLTYTETAIL